MSTSGAEGPEASVYGGQEISRNDGADKSAYKAIKNMITILDDTDGSFFLGRLDLIFTKTDNNI